MSIAIAQIGHYGAGMDNRLRAEAFTRYVGMELKGAIAARGFTAAQVAEATGRSASALNRWLNGKNAIPVTVLYETCELIGADPKKIVDNAYSRVRRESAPALTLVDNAVSDADVTIAASDYDHSNDVEGMEEVP